VPRSSHSDWAPSGDRPDPIGLLEEQAASRVPELVPIRHGRMMASPFAFFRGAAYLMASDLAGTPRSGMRAQLCGDAHLSNFGGLPRKRCRELAQISVQSYRQTMLTLAGMSERDVWYSKVDASEFAQAVGSQGTRRQVKRLRKLVAKAYRKDSSRAFEKLTANVDGTPRIIADHPLIVPIEDLLPDTEVHQVESWARGLIKTYRSTLQNHHRQLFDRYDYAHLARKVVGVGSVGTRAWVVLFVGSDQNEPLFLQCKEAQPSVSSHSRAGASTATWAGGSSRGSG
jgi:uncharacterized protein (DUF2252 family)